ncbi:restriction endonuclease [bacterium]|nr:restriction endonuclease [bacterium]
MYWLLDPQKQKEIRTTIKEIGELIMSAEVNPWACCKNAYIFSGRKSSDIASRVIIYFKKISQTKGIHLYDPFMGSGIIVYEAIRNKCKITAGDIDNYSWYLVDLFLKPLDKKKIITLFKELEDKIKQKIMDLYSTVCCEEQNYIDKLYFDPNPIEFYNPMSHPYMSNGKNIIMAYKCPKCENGRKRFSEIDKKKIDSVNLNSGYRFPSHNLIINARINITPGKTDHYDCFFTKRNQYALCLLQEAILELEKSSERDFLQMALVTALHLMKITDYKAKSQDLYHIPDKCCVERNVWLCFADRFNKVMKFKFDDEGLGGVLKSDFTKPNIYNLSYNDTPVVDGSVDLIFSEPPYSELVPYLERNQLFRDWLYFWTGDEIWKFSNYMKQKEVIITDSPERNNKRGWKQYYSSLDEIFDHFSKKIKVHGYCVLFFRAGKKRWMEIINKIKLSARKAGFEPIHRIAYAKADPSMRYLWSSNWSITSDSLIFFLKLDETERYYYEGDVWLDKVIYKTLQNRIKEKKELKFLEAVSIILNEANSQGLKTLYLNAELIHLLIKRYFDILPNQTLLPKIDITIFEDFRKETIQNRILDWTPRIVEDLLKEKEAFNYNDYIYNLSLYLDNGDKDAIESLNEDKGFIVSVLKNYVDETNKGFVKKKIVLPVKAKNKIDLHTLSGKEFEVLVKEVLIKEGYKDVVITGRPSDKGVDIEAKINGSKVIVQCKNWRHNVGSTPIQRLHSYQMARDKDKAICITTSDFTQDGKIEAEKTRVEIIDGKQIRGMIERWFAGKYY